jgi:hypothetical protein
MQFVRENSALWFLIFLLSTNVRIEFLEEEAQKEFFYLMVTTAVISGSLFAIANNL